MSQNEDEEEEEKTNEIKVILIGDSGVGKTNLINKALGKRFNETENVTAAANFSVKNMTINGKEFKIKLWDTIGQEKFRQLSKIFFSNSKIVILVYDITNKVSFEALPNWLKDVEEEIGLDFVRGVVANKMDLYLNEEVKGNEGEEYAKSINAKFLATSAKKDDPKIFIEFLGNLLTEYLSLYKENTVDSLLVTRRKSTIKKNKNSNCC